MVWRSMAKMMQIMPRRASQVLLVVLAFASAMLLGCKNGSEPAGSSATTPPVERVSAPESQDGAASTADISNKALPVEPEDPTRWLSGEAASSPSTGGWVEGSFDRQRNRIEIRTKGISRFRIDTSRMAIDWDKLVVIQIDGTGAELKHRENPVIRFEQDGLGHWKVVE